MITSISIVLLSIGMLLVSKTYRNHLKLHIMLRERVELLDQRVADLYRRVNERLDVDLKHGHELLRLDGSIQKLRGLQKALSDRVDDEARTIKGAVNVATVVNEKCNEVIARVDALEIEHDLLVHPGSKQLVPTAAEAGGTEDGDNKGTAPKN